MFQTIESWEIMEGTEILRALAGQPDLRQYRMFEIALNTPTYRLDVVLPEKFSKDQVLRRFRLHSLGDALQFIKEANPVETRLTQETPFEDGEADQLRQITAVSSAFDKHGRNVFICESLSGTFNVSWDSSSYNGPVSNQRKIWPRDSSLVKG
ncbi:hypothetical protein GJ699_00270 [Duganella sp. FT80W]|uniref:Uncharacterized protein n=1 Tax=Duganella guangzhouensis TaxID=2666084 RepID=A0A6I2KS39_9BURK|nr:hypothetical protein [Duganella guangzhouensis]MRW88418.1 hypothetical protein [Duganella guangzhouensis]